MAKLKTSIGYNQPEATGINIQVQANILPHIASGGPIFLNSTGMRNSHKTHPNITAMDRKAALR